MIRNKSGKKKLLSSSEGMGHGVEAGLLDGPPGLLFPGLPAGRLGPGTTCVWSGLSTVRRKPVKDLSAATQLP